MVSTASGALVDEGPLYRALVSGQLAGAGLDFLEQEPIDPDNPLLTLDNVTDTTHQRPTHSRPTKANGLLDAIAIIDVPNGRIPQNLLNWSPSDTRTEPEL